MRKFVIAVAALGLLAGSACGGDKKDGASPTTTASGQAPAATIKALGTTWEPDDISIKTGDVVKFDISGSIVHDLKGDEGISHKAGSKFSVEHKFNTEGTFSYQCTIHAGMTGTITVS